MFFSVAKSRTAFLATFASVGAALCLGAIASPISAKTNYEMTYRAELAAPTEETSIIAAGIAWRCAGTVCVAGKSSSRPAIVCRKLVREVGPLASFATKGELMSADKLASCNG